MIFIDGLRLKDDVKDVAANSKWQADKSSLQSE